MVPARMLSTRFGPWLFSLVLFVPVLVFYLGHFTSSWTDANLTATGFVQTDMAYYMANAREYFDQDRLHLFYPSAFTSGFDGSPIYFQPHTIVLAIVWWLTGVDPGLLFCVFGLMCGVACLRFAVALWKDSIGFESCGRVLGFVLFVWGGGVMTVAGIAYTSWQQGGLTLSNPWVFDPYGGWWFLNFGRNLVYPTEAFYHLLFLGVAYFALHQKYAGLFALLVVLSWAHPFTGLQALAVVLVWYLVELYSGGGLMVLRRAAIVLGLIVVHLLYYLWFLNLDSNHRVLQEQWGIDWSYKAPEFTTAYVLVAVMASWQARTPERLRQMLAVPFNRFLAVWAAVSFLLANHEFAVAPVQPLHFTRGYVWTPLFLLGARSLTDLLDRTLGGRRVALRGLVVVAVCGLFVFDNGTWFFARTLRQHRAQNGFHLSTEATEVLETLDRFGSHRTLVVSQDLELGYLAVVYTPNRAWVSHPFNTPFREQKERDLEAFFGGGSEPGGWMGRRLLVVEQSGNPRHSIERHPGLDKILENTSYRVYLRP
jgi:hypothetical protein